MEYYDGIALTPEKLREVREKLEYWKTQRPQREGHFFDAERYLVNPRQLISEYYESLTQPGIVAPPRPSFPPKLRLLKGGKR